MIAVLFGMVGVVELDRASCLNHFQANVLPLLTNKLNVVRPGLKNLRWQARDRENRTEWQPNGVPTVRTGFTFSRWSRSGNLEIELSGRYMEKYPREVHGVISISGPGEWPEENYKARAMQSFGIVKPFRTAFPKKPPPYFPKVTVDGTTFELSVSPLGSHSRRGVTTVDSAQFSAIIVLRR